VPARARRRLLAGALAAAVIAAVYLGIVRDLSLFRVETVSLRGAGSSYVPAFRRDLLRAARSMTTLHVDASALRRAARRYPAVVSLAADADLPHRLVVTVVERPPVGTVSAGGRRRLSVAADGTVLAGESIDRPLPRIAGSVGPGARRAPAEVADAARLAAAAAPELAAWLQAIRHGDEGWVVSLRRGPEVRFGTLTRVSEKWSAAASVLGARSAGGAGYIDVRLPDRPAAGGFKRRAPLAEPARPNPRVPLQVETTP